jgi:hypothetical protein
VKRKGNEKERRAERGGCGLVSVSCWDGLGPGHGPSWAAGFLFLIFFCAVSFLIFYFLFLSQILHIESKQGKTNF